ncbi:hypothetical protein J3459_007660 [Metarhizium acridum]|uniref:uncharacterized protein n=1 Tax=Metarhizium acridum TaxID=92637 RepID=UPI001C6CC6F1|nr:hypothetical protein J3458_007043 [Metarhizium acridum]KAG8426940.1 hypothetical protein J3459_007660 [Metarhizium acridum]
MRFETLFRWANMNAMSLMEKIEFFIAQSFVRVRYYYPRSNAPLHCHMHNALYFVATLKFPRFARVASLSDRRHFVKHAAVCSFNSPIVRFTRDHGLGRLARLAEVRR